MNRDEVKARVEEVGIVPAVRVSSEHVARFAAEAVAAGGIPIVEISMSTPGAIRVISDLAKSAPDLVVGGRVTNASGQPINYVHLLFAFEDEDGKVLHAESTYNHMAASMADDEEMEQILKEKPHFTPLKPGDSDTFAMSVPVILLPRFAKVELFSNDTRP